MSTVVLTGIFKNEAAGILKTLEPLAPLVDLVAVLDTGSVDGTPELIEQWMKDNGKKGVVVRGTWPGRFDVARNQCMGLANVSGADFCLEVDADWILTGDIAGLKASLDQPAQQDAHALQFEVVTQASVIKAARLRRCNAPFLWRGGVHEELTWQGPGTPKIGFVEGTKFYYMNTTSEEKRQERYKRDVEILMQDAETNTRSQFYLGQTWQHLGDQEKAADWYIKRGETLSGPPGERAVALFRAAIIRNDINLFKQSFLVDPTRAEPLWEMAFRNVKGAAELARTMPVPKHAQFIFQEYYSFHGPPTNNQRLVEFREKQLNALCDFSGVT